MQSAPELVVVDDEPRVANALKLEIGLEFPSAPFSIRTFNDAASCAEHVREHPDSVFLVISDLRMPGMNGSELLARIRALSADIQTMLLTAFVDVPDIQRAVSTSIQSLLLKPWTSESLVAEVNKAWHTWTLRKENEALKREIDLLLGSAGDFQMNLFSAAIPQGRFADFDVSFLPHQQYHCGGDFYDIIDLGEGRYTILLGDVSGHGPRSAMVAAMAKTAIRLTIDQRPDCAGDPGLLVARLNDFFCKMLEGAQGLLIALSAVHIDCPRASCTVVSAGQPSALIAGKDGAILLEGGNHAIGVIPASRFQAVSINLNPGDCLALYTDGLVESTHGQMMLDRERIRRELAVAGKLPAAAITQRFRNLLPGSVFTDDVTLITVRYPGPPK